MQQKGILRMISYIRGELAEVLEDSIIVESSGIGFQIRVPVSVLEEMPEEGSEVKIYTYFNVREDAMQLFGFLDREDLRIFEMLLGVNGIGPKGAIGILSAISGEDLQFAVLADDAKTISKAPGIGLKTAQKLILELKDKMKLEDAFAIKARRIARRKENETASTEEKVSFEGGGSSNQNGKENTKKKASREALKKSSERKKAPSGAEARNEAVLALTALGYSGTEALKAVRQVDGTEQMTTEQIMKEALKKLL